MARINSHITADYLDAPGGNPADDHVVIREDHTDQEAVLPVTDLPDLIKAAQACAAAHTELVVEGKPFLGNPGQTVIIPAYVLGILEGVLVYFNKGATATSRPPVTFQSFDNADDMMTALFGPGR